MMNKPPPIPPPIPPPPISHRNHESDASHRLYWMIAPAVLLGLLIAIFFLSWIVNRSDNGLGNDATESGSTPTVAVSLDQENGNVSNQGTQTTSNNANSAVADESTSDPLGTKDPNESKVPSSVTNAANEEDVANNQETILRIVEEKRTSKPSQSGAMDANLAARGGVNPFVGTGTPAKTTVYVIDVSGSMQTSDRLPRVISTLKVAVDLLHSDQKFTIILLDDSAHICPVGNGLL